MEKFKKVLKITLIVIASLFALYCFEELASYYYFDRDNLNLWAKIGCAANVAGVIFLIIYVSSLHSYKVQSEKYKNEHCIMEIAEQCENPFGKRFISSNQITRFLDDNEVDKHFFSEYIFALGIRNQMEWYEIVQRLREAEKTIASCCGGVPGILYTHPSMLRDKYLRVDTWNGNPAIIHSNKVEEWNAVQETLKEINEDAEYFVRANYNLKNQLYNWQN